MLRHAANRVTPGRHVPALPAWQGTTCWTCHVPERALCSKPGQPNGRRLRGADLFGSKPAAAGRPAAKDASASERRAPGAGTGKLGIFSRRRKLVADMPSGEARGRADGAAGLATTAPAGADQLAHNSRQALSSRIPAGSSLDQAAFEAVRAQFAKLRAQRERAAASGSAADAGKPGASTPPESKSFGLFNITERIQAAKASAEASRFQARAKREQAHAGRAQQLNASAAPGPGSTSHMARHRRPGAPAQAERGSGLTRQQRRMKALRAQAAKATAGRSWAERKAAKRAAVKSVYGARAVAPRTAAAVQLGESPVAVRDLALKLSVKPSVVLKVMRDMGERCTKDTKLEPDIAEVVCTELGADVTRVAARDLVPAPRPTEEEAEAAGLPIRQPVVAVMGHVDHGKTSLLDCLRGGAGVAATEAGGITQAVAAFEARLSDPVVPLERSSQPSSKPGKQKKPTRAGSRKPAGKVELAVDDVDALTFVDTPGHALFSGMRARGAAVTDVVVLVVAAEDGVMPQTRESVRMIVEAGVPAVVALTKVDKYPDYQRKLTEVSEALLEEGLTTEDMGGDVPVIPVSSMTGEGIQQLKDTIAMVASMAGLRADTQAPGEAAVLETQVVKGLGPVVDAVLQWGTLRVGDTAVLGTQAAKVRALLAPDGSRLRQATAGQAVRISGWAERPPSEGVVLVAPGGAEEAATVLRTREARAKARAQLESGRLAETRRRDQLEAVATVRRREKMVAEMQSRDAARQRLAKAGHPIPATLQVAAWETDLRAELERLLQAGEAVGIEKGKQQVLQDAVLAGRTPVRLLLKAGTVGGLSALRASLQAIDDTHVHIKPVRSELGDVHEADIQFAADLQAAICGFDVRAPATVERKADKAGVPLILDKVIYQLVENIAAHASTLVPTAAAEQELGRAEVGEMFYMNTSGAKRVPSVVLGCVVKSGTLSRSARFKVLRGEQVLLDAAAPESLQRFKDKVDVVEKGLECGVALPNAGDVEFEQGDVVVAYKLVSETVQVGVKYDHELARA